MPGPLPDDQAYAQALDCYARLLDRQVREASGWPAVLQFPEPRTPAGRRAFARLCTMLEVETGAPMRVRLW